MIVKGKEVEVNVKRTRYADGYGMVWYGMVWYGMVYFILMIHHIPRKRRNILYKKVDKK